MANNVSTEGQRGQRVATVFNGSAPGANTAILSTSITPSKNVTAYRVTVALTTASVFNVTCYDGTTTHKWGLDKSTALQAGDLYAYVFAVSANDDGTEDGTGTALQYNFEVETDGVIELLLVDEIVGGVV